MASLLPALLAMQAKPIKTYYRGNWFRSRLEARWAVFLRHTLDNTGFKYVYEPEGFDLNNGLWYLPDFEVPEWDDSYLEVKPRWPLTRQELDKVIGLCVGTGKNVYVLAGQPWLREYTLIEFCSLPPSVEGIERYLPSPCRDTKDPSLIYHLRSNATELLLCKELPGYEKPFICCSYDLKRSVLASTAEFAQCRKCQAISPVTYFNLGKYVQDECRKCGTRWCHIFALDEGGLKLFSGFYAARSATFKRGEQPWL